MSTSHVDKSLELVRSAVSVIGKKPLACRAGIPDGCLRRVGDPDFSPTARTLRKLEDAAVKVLAECAAPSTIKDASHVAP